VTTLAGLAGSSGSADGTNSDARFKEPNGVAVDSADNLYVADTANCTIRRVTPPGVVSTLAGLPGALGGDDGTNGQARFVYPQGVAVDNAGNLYVADFYFNTIRKGYAPPMFWNSEINLGQFRSVLTGPPGQLVVVEKHRR